MPPKQLDRSDVGPGNIIQSTRRPSARPNTLAPAKSPTKSRKKKQPSTELTTEDSVTGDSDYKGDPFKGHRDLTRDSTVDDNEPKNTDTYRLFSTAEDDEHELKPFAPAFELSPTPPRHTETPSDIHRTPEAVPQAPPEAVPQAPPEAVPQAPIFPQIQTSTEPQVLKLAPAQKLNSSSGLQFGVSGFETATTKRKPFSSVQSFNNVSLPFTNKPIPTMTTNGSTEAGPSTRSVRTSQSNANRDVRYTQANFQRDALCLNFIFDRCQQGNYPHVKELFDKDDERTVRAIIKAMTADTKRKVDPEVRSSINAPTSFVNTIDGFIRFLERFRNGPTEEEESIHDSIETDQERLARMGKGKQPVRPQEDQHETRREQQNTEHTEGQPDLPPLNQDERPRRRSHQHREKRHSGARTENERDKRHHEFQLPARDIYSSLPPSRRSHHRSRSRDRYRDRSQDRHRSRSQDRYRDRSQDHHRSRSRNLRRRRRGDSPSSPSDSSSEDENRRRSNRRSRRPARKRRSSSYSRSETDEYTRPVKSRHDRKLRPQDIGEYDGTTSVNIFLQRIATMINGYGKKEVLSALPLCLKLKARDWYDMLPGNTLRRMDVDPHEWVYELRLRFQKDQAQAEEEAKDCVFRFAKEHELSLREYVTKKQGLLREAGYEEEARIIHQIWRGLDPSLMNAINMIPRETLNEFIHRIYLQEYAAKSQWKQYLVQAQAQHPYRTPFTQRNVNEGVTSYPYRTPLAQRNVNEGVTSYPYRAPLAQRNVNEDVTIQRAQYRPLVARNAIENTPFPRTEYRQTVTQTKPETAVEASKTVTTDKAKVTEAGPPGRIGPRYPCRICGGDHYDSYHRNEQKFQRAQNQRVYWNETEEMPEGEHEEDGFIEDYGQNESENFTQN